MKKDYCVRKAFSDVQREAKRMANSNNDTTNSNNNRRIVDLKTGKTKQEEEYEKTIRLLKLMSGRS